MIASRAGSTGAERGHEDLGRDHDDKGEDGDGNAAKVPNVLSEL